MRQVFVIVVENFLGHAVIAAEVAAVGNADTQIAQGTTALVTQQPGGLNGFCGDNGRAVAKIKERNDTF